MRILVYHHDDADGLMAAAIVRYAILKQPKEQIPDFVFQQFSYNKADDFKDLSSITKDSFNQVYMVDCFLGVQQVKYLLQEFGENFIWIDHHLSAIEAWKKDGSGQIEGIQNTFNSACYLTWQFFFGKAVPVPECVNQVNNFDIWKKTEVWDSITYPWQLVISTFLNNPATFDNALFLDEEKMKQYIQAIGVPIMKYDEKIQKSMLQSVMRVKLNIPGFPEFLFINSPLKTSRLFEDYLQESEIENKDKIKGFINAYILKPNVWSVSIYRASGSDFDAQAIAKKYGGGGHKAAAGFQISDQDFRKLLEFDLKKTTKLPEKNK